MKSSVSQSAKQKAANLDGRTKAAVLLACLGPGPASRILSVMNQEEIEQLTINLAGLGAIEPEVREAVVEEFHQMMVANRYVTQGGIEYARNVLEAALSPEKALEILTRLQSSLQEVPFDFLKRADPSQIVSFIQEEHPQTLALILAHLEPQVAAVVLSSLSQEVRSEVVMRVAKIDRTPPEIVREVERVLERKMASVFSQGFTFAGGVKDVAEILNRVEDLVNVDDSGIQKALREVEQKDLALALKAANEEVTTKIFRNMSERARELIKEEMEFMGPVRLRHVEEAQQKIVAVIRRLEETGEIIIEGRGAGGEDEIIV